MQAKFLFYYILKYKEPSNELDVILKKRKEKSEK